MKKLWLIYALSLGSNQAYAQDTIIVPEHMYRFDHGKKLVVANLGTTHINTHWTQPKSDIWLGAYYHFDTPISQVHVGTAYTIADEQDSTYSLYFTGLPLIHISTGQEIVDEPKVPAAFTLSDTGQNIIHSHIGIEYRGSWTQTLPKKSFRIEFWEDELGNNTKDYSLLGLRKDDDWNLQAMYNEPLRLNNKVSNQLWLNMHSLYYQAAEPTAIAGIRMEYAELFLNGEYRGLYAVGESVDRKQLQLKDYNGDIRGELYKGIDWLGATSFDSVPGFINKIRFWGGFEYEYPEEKVRWNALHNFVDFVVNDNNDNFYQHYRSRFHLGNAVDYFIFLNLLRATDNWGKNIFIAKYKVNEPYFYIPWDLDGSFGILWDGSRQFMFEDILSNGFYRRMMSDCSDDAFTQKLRDRWNELRQHTVTHAHIMDMFVANHDYLFQNGVYERESKAWPGFVYNYDHIDYTAEWLENRLIYLDTKFNEACSPLDIETYGSSVSPAVYPNPAKDHFKIGLGQQVQLPATLSIYNMNGQLVLQQELAGEETLIPTEHMPDGMYFVSIATLAHHRFEKLVIQH